MHKGHMDAPARAGYEEFLRILGNEAPDDERLQNVAGSGGSNGVGTPNRA